VKLKWHGLSGLLTSVALVVLAMVPTTRAVTQGSHIVVPVSRSWAEAAVATVQSLEQPVGLPGTTYAYDITVASLAPTPPTGHLVRINLATGQVALGPSLPSGSDLFVVRKAVAVLLPTSTQASGAPQGPYRLRLVLGQSVALSQPITLKWSGSTESTLSNSPALTDGGIWLPTLRGAQLFSATSGAVLKKLEFGAQVADIAPSPDGTLLYVVLDELAVNPVAKVGTVIDEVSATTGRVIAHQGLVSTSGGALLTPVNRGVWASYRGGMMGTSALYLSPRLAMLPWPKLDNPQGAVPRYGSDVTDGTRAISVGNTLWLESATGISCNLPTPAKFLAGIAFNSAQNASSGPWTPFAASHGLLYATTANRILAVRPPTICGVGGSDLNA
jgi:hypothetical protein